MKNLKQFISEKYFTRVGNVELFTNPSRSDIRELAKTINEDRMVRFIADASTESVIVWDAFHYTHLGINKELIRQGLWAKGTDIYRDRDLYYCAEGSIASDNEHIKFELDLIHLPFPTTTDPHKLQAIRTANTKLIDRFGFVERYVDGFTVGNAYAKQNKKIDRMLSI